LKELQLEDKYTQIPNSIVDGLCKVKIHNSETRMFMQIIRLTYGCHHRSAAISTSLLMKNTGLSRPQIHKARKNLLNMKMITVTTEGHSQVKTYTIQEDFTKWHCNPRRSQLPRKVTGVTTGGHKILKRKTLNKYISKDIVDTSKTSKPKTLTPIQQIIKYYIHAQEFDDLPGWNEKAWNRANFGRFAKCAKTLLETFENDTEKVYQCIDAVKKELTQKKLDWTLETVVKRAPYFIKALEKQRRAEEDFKRRLNPY